MLDQSLNTIKQQSETAKRDISDYMSKERRQERKEKVNASLSNFAQNIKDKVAPLGEKTRILVTKTGKFIETHGEDIGSLADSLIGMTFGDLYTQQNKDQPELVSAYTDELDRVAEYNEFAEQNPHEMTIQDWRGYIANISALLESQLRFSMKVKDPKMALSNLIGKAKKKKVIEGYQANKLHEFRTIRNEVIHTIPNEITYPDRVLWTGKFVQDFDADVIQGIAA